MSSIVRRAILVGASPSTNPIPSVLKDIARWSAFLLSDIGGAWREEEIVSLTNCSRNALREAVRTVANAYYTLVVFAGQGEIVKSDLPWSEAHVLLSDGESITERELNTGSPSCVLVFDCWPRHPSDEKVNVEASRAGASRDPGRDLPKYRALFDQSLTAAEKGLVKVYAIAQSGVSTPNETFSERLLDIANRWASENRGVLSIQEAVSLAAKASPNQNAEYQGGRRLRHFPLAVSA